MLGAGMHLEAGDTEQRRIADPAAEHGARFQPLGPPGVWLAGLILPGRPECLGMVFETFQPEIAIGSGIMRVETAHRDERRDVGIGLGHGIS